MMKIPMRLAKVAVVRDFSICDADLMTPTDAGRLTPLPGPKSRHLKWRRTASWAGGEGESWDSSGDVHTAEFQQRSFRDVDRRGQRTGAYSDPELTFWASPDFSSITLSLSTKPSSDLFYLASRLSINPATWPGCSSTTMCAASGTTCTAAFGIFSAKRSAYPGGTMPSFSPQIISAGWVTRWRRLDRPRFGIGHKYFAAVDIDFERSTR